MKSWWLEAFDGAPPPSRLPAAADVVVVGAGMTAAALAHHLHRLQPHDAPASCVLLDAANLAAGATGTNGGHLWPNPASDFERATTAELVAFIRQSGVDCDLTRLGAAALELRRDEATYYDDELDPERASAEFAWEGTLPDEGSWWDEATCARQLHSEAFASGTHFSEAYQMHAAKVAGALLRSAPSARLVAPARALSIARAEGREGHRWEVTTTAGTLYARDVVVAANGWSAELLPRLRGILRPCRNQVLMCRPNVAGGGSRLWDVGGLSVGDGAREIYAIRRARDGLVCVGGARAVESNCGVDSTEATLSTAVGDHLRSFLVRSFPDCFRHPLQVEAEWVGILGFTRDGYPLCGQLPNEEGLFIAAGYNGNGMPQCFGVGKAIAQMIRGEHAAVDPWVRERMDPGRFDELSAGAFDSSEAF